MKTKTLMRKLAVLAAAASVLLGIGFAPSPVSAQGTYFWWDVVDERGESYTGQNVQCSVFRPQTHAAIVWHTTAQLTQGYANPIFSDASGKLHFYSSSTDPVNVNCYYANGGSAQVSRLDRFTHRIVIPRQAGLIVSRFAINDTATATNQSAGISFPAGALIRDVIIQNLNPRGIGTYHVSVGFAGNHSVSANVNALVNIQALNSPDEWIRQHVLMINTGVNERADASHRGLALRKFIAGHGDATGSLGFYAEIPYLVHVASGLDVTYAINPGTAGAARLHVLILWSRYHSGIDRTGLRN